MYGGYQKEMESNFKENMEEIEDNMSDLSYGVRKYLKRKNDGSIDYMYSYKSSDGEIDYIQKSGKANQAVSIQENSPPVIPRSVRFRLDNDESAEQEEDQETSTEPKPPRPDDETKEEGKEEEGSEPSEDFEFVNNGLLTQKEEATLPTPSNLFSLTESICPHCNNKQKDCHANKYGRFLVYLGYTAYDGKYEEEKEKLKEHFRLTYHTAREWEDRIKNNTHQAIPIKRSTVEANVPKCLERYRDMWLTQIKENKVITRNNYTYAVVSPLKSEK